MTATKAMEVILAIINIIYERLPFTLLIPEKGELSLLVNILPLFILLYFYFSLPVYLIKPLPRITRTALIVIVIMIIPFMICSYTPAKPYFHSSRRYIIPFRWDVYMFHALLILPHISIMSFINNRIISLLKGRRKITLWLIAFIDVIALLAILLTYWTVVNADLFMGGPAGPGD